MVTPVKAIRVEVGLIKNLLGMADKKEHLLLTHFANSDSLRPKRMRNSILKFKCDTYSPTRKTPSIMLKIRLCHQIDFD